MLLPNMKIESCMRELLGLHPRPGYGVVIPFLDAEAQAPAWTPLTVGVT